MPRSRNEVLKDISDARARLHDLELELLELGPVKVDESPNLNLSLQEYKRYGRQIILNSVRLQGQLQLKRAHILVVGAGGLGCPVLMYLAAAGVGQITVLDHDDVELSNLHRQVLHTESRIGMPKAKSAQLALQSLNSDVIVNAHVVPFIPALFHDLAVTAPSTVLADEPPFSLVLDCTDNPATRHFLNSYAVAHNIPLVSGGAVRTDGVVGVYGLQLGVSPAGPPARGPCYACVFPSTPACVITGSICESDESPDSGLAADLAAERTALAGTGACSDEGVLGILCGVVGLQMAAEAIKVLLGKAKPTLHLLSPLSPSPLRTVKVRERKVDCPACGDLPSESNASESSGARSRWNDFLASGQWPGWSDPLCERPGPSSDPLRTGENQITVRDLFGTLQTSPTSATPILIDVRPKVEFEICSISGSSNLPFAQFLRQPELALAQETDSARASATSRDIYLICRRGNDSRLAARALRRYIDSTPPDSGRAEPRVFNVVGGVTAWSKQVDPTMPVY